MPGPFGVVTGFSRVRQAVLGRVGAAAVSLAYLSASTGWAAESKGGMPQLDFANPLTISQVVWLAIIFVVLYLLLSRWALPHVAAVLEMRANKIATDLDAAKAAKSDADAAVAELTTATRTAQATAQGEIAAAVATAKESAAAQSATLNARLEAQLGEAEQRIGEARAAAMGALRHVATDAATAVVARLTGAAPAAATVDAAVGVAMAARAA